MKFDKDRLKGSKDKEQILKCYRMNDRLTDRLTDQTSY